ncbi:MAG: hypothetical protein EU531_06635 [Promethearchaeota archaeon]|nr:MAG: hypothetical protein EU531_06635 [Candidatus Lokiarchaeota archaeon]
MIEQKELNFDKFLDGLDLGKKQKKERKNRIHLKKLNLRKKDGTHDIIPNNLLLKKRNQLQVNIILFNYISAIPQ